MPTYQQYLQSIFDTAAAMLDDLKVETIAAQAPLFLDEIKKVDDQLSGIQDAIAEAAAEASAMARQHTAEVVAGDEHCRCGRVLNVNGLCPMSTCLHVSASCSCPPVGAGRAIW